MDPDSRDMLALHHYMVMCRVLEAACGAANPRWFPAEGEEAAIVGTFYGLRPDDVVAPHYRGPFVVYVMRGAEMARLCAQVLGKETGYWNAIDHKWVTDESYSDFMKAGLKVARKQAAPDFLTVSVRAPQEAK